LSEPLTGELIAQRIKKGAHNLSWINTPRTHKVWSPFVHASAYYTIWLFSYAYFALARFASMNSTAFRSGIEMIKEKFASETSTVL